MNRDSLEQHRQEYNNWEQKYSPNTFLEYDGPDGANFNTAKNNNHTCDYTWEWVTVKIRWQLTVDEKEHETLTDTTSITQKAAK